MPKHRALAAIMFTDIAGYTALMAKDEENALRILQKNRDTIKVFVSQFNGDWLKEMGDGTLSSFGSVVDAVNCALEIQNELRDEPDFRLRIGIHIGDVVVEEGDVFGDGVNVASRIEKLAEPGGVCISDRVYYDIQNKPYIEATLVGEKSLKNVAQPIKVFCIRKAGAITVSHSTHPATQSISLPFRPSIAVLPFIDMSPEKDQEYFCDGIAEEIINALTHIENLRVVARTSAFYFKGKDVKIRDIGRELNVETVLEGSVRKAGNRLRITAQLIKVDDGFHLWSERYDRELEDVFAIQDEISLAVVRELKVRLLKGEETAVVKRYTVDTEAYELYLKGRYFWSRREEVGLKKGIECFQQAIEKDPHYALAHAGMADCYKLLGAWGLVRPREAFSQMKKAIEKAFELDNMLAEAHASLAGYKLDYEWDFPGSEKELNISLEINPNYITAHSWYSLLLVFMERFEESFAEVHRALQLDPLSLLQNAGMGWVYSFAKRYNEAMKYYQRALEMDPCFALTHLCLGHHYIGEKKWEKAIATFDTYKTLTAGSPISLGHLGFAYACAGRKNKALKLLEQLENQSEERYVSPYYKALVFIGIDDKDQAFEYLEKACAEREFFLVSLKVNPVFDSLRDDLRFDALLKKVGLPED